MAGRGGTVPTLRIVPFPSRRDDSARLPLVTPDLFVQAAALAALHDPEHGTSILLRGLEQAQAVVAPLS